MTESEIPVESSPKSFFGRLTGVYFSPGDTFRGFVDNPGFIAPMIGLIVLGGIVGYFIFSRVDFTVIIAESIDKMVEAGRITKEQAPQIIAQQAKFAKIMALVGGLVGNVIFSLVIAGVFKLISMVMTKENAFTSLWSVTMYTLLAIGIVSSALLVILMFIKGADFDIRNPIGSNLGSVLSLAFEKASLPAFVWSLARSVDVFYIWIIALLAIGYSAVSRRLKPMTAGVILGCLYVAMAIIGAGISAVTGG